MFRIREITDTSVMDPDFPERKYVLETDNFELMLVDWEGVGAGEVYESSEPPPQVLYTRREAEAIARAMDAASTLLAERCEHCGAVLEDTIMEDE